MSGYRPGVKHDNGKLRWTLLLEMLGPQVRDVVRVLQYGAEKYNEDQRDPNYRKLENARYRLGDAVGRHFIDGWLAGERIDPETKAPHLACAVVNLLFLMWHDDNPGGG